MHERYHRELIERFAVCPWAKPARMDGRTRVHVIVEASCSQAALQPTLQAWVADAAVEVAFLIVPRFAGDAAEFADWAASIAASHSDVFLAAPFYPTVSESAGSVQFLRQTPDPTVQLVRRSRLEEIRSQDPPHYTDIFDLDLSELAGDTAHRTVAASVLAHNERMLEREGKAELAAVLRDIREDRDRTYAKLFPLLQ